MPRSATSTRWRVLPGDIQAEARLQMELGVHPVMARLLVQRGHSIPEAAYAFLHPSLDNLHDPFLLPDARVACERLKTAIINKERILIYGDYDGDGITSAALWTRCLRRLGGTVNVFVPHRKRQGYDIRMPAIEQAKQDGVNLIVTTDCGIQRIDEVEHAREYGIDVIITDHHAPNANGKLPRAVAVVNPHRKDSQYPFPDIAGVGVAFKLCEALTVTMGFKAEKFRQAFLDLACIGTVTDMMPLVDENRVLVSFGLPALRASKKVGLRALTDISGYSDKTVDAHAIGFQIGPRLNAAGRVDETQPALDILMTDDPAAAAVLARKLNDLNVRRQENQARVLEEVLEQVARQDISEVRCLVISGSWTGGMVGLVAGKVAQMFHRPAVVIAMDEATGSGRGSARSVHPFNMFDAIDSCRGLLDEYGGHAHAAGLSIQRANVPDFTAEMNRIACALLTDEDLQPTIDISAELNPGEMCSELLMQMQALAPFGHSNQEPIFASREVPIRDVRLLKDKHLKLRVKADGLNGSDLVDALWWNNGARAQNMEAGQIVDICYRPGFNDWNGRRSIQFLIEDIKPPYW